MKDTFHGTATLYRNEKTGTVIISIPKEEGGKLNIENKETLIFESDGEEIRLVPARTVKLFKNKELRG